MEDSIENKMVELALAKLSLNELEMILKLSENALKETSKYQANSHFLEQLKSDQFSTAFKTVNIVVNRTWRALSLTSSPIKRVALVKELVSLREKCALRAMVSSGFPEDHISSVGETDDSSEQAEQ